MPLTGINTVGLRGVGSEGFVRTVQKLTVTDDLSIIGDINSTGGLTINTDGVILVSGSDIDMGTTGARIDLDTDNDTSIRASGDDVIMLEVAGNDAWKLQWWQTTLTADYSTNVNQYAYRDAAGQATWHSYFSRGTEASPAVVQADDILTSVTAHGMDATDGDFRRAGEIVITVDGTPGSSDMPGRIVFSTTADGAATVTERMRITNGGNLMLGDTANAKTTIGLTINQGASDDEVLSCKSSDIAHAFVSGGFQGSETDTYLAVTKANATLGGTRFGVFAEDAAVNEVCIFNVQGGTAQTTKTTGGIGMFNINVCEHDGANSIANVTADGNVFSVRARVGGSTVTRILVDEDGDMYTATTGQTFDAYDDAQLVRALDRSKSNYIRDEWDDFTIYNETSLIDAGILGAPIAEGGMTNITQLQRLHNGAIWQGYKRSKELEAKVAVLENRLLAIEGGK